MTDSPIVLSNSSVQTYLRCNWKFYLSEVMRLPATPNMAMALGSAVHAGIERLLKGGDQRPIDAFTKSFAQQMTLIAVPDEDPAEALADGLRMLATYTAKVAPTFKPTLVEQKFVIRLEGIYWTGIIDGADEDLRDVKTTAGKTINGRKPSFDPQRHRLQVTGYRLGYKALTGKWPRRLLLDVLKRTGKYQQYELEPDTDGLIDVIRLTRDAIMRRSFEPTGTLNGSCHSCSYREVCAYSNAKET